MKVLNLDKFEGANPRKVRIKGVEHVVKPMTVKAFIDTTRAAEALADSDSVPDQIEATVDLVIRSVPTLTRDDLEGFELEQLQAIVGFVRGDEDIKGVEQSEGAEGQPGN